MNSVLPLPIGPDTVEVKGCLNGNIFLTRWWHVLQQSIEPRFDLLMRIIAHRRNFILVDAAAAVVVASLI